MKKKKYWRKLVKQNKYNPLKEMEKKKNKYQVKYLS